MYEYYEKCFWKNGVSTPAPPPHPTPTRPPSILEQMLSPHIFSFYSKKCVIEKFIAACNFSKNTGLPEFFFTGF